MYGSEIRVMKGNNISNNADRGDFTTGVQVVLRHGETASPPAASLQPNSMGESTINVSCTCSLRLALVHSHMHTHTHSHTLLHTIHRVSPFDTLPYPVKPSPAQLFSSLLSLRAVRPDFPPCCLFLPWLFSIL